MDLAQLWKYLDPVILGNTLAQYLIALAVFLALLIGLIIFKRILAGSIKKYGEKSLPKTSALLGELLSALKVFVFPIISLHFALATLTLSQVWSKRISIFVFAVLTFQVLLMLTRAIGFLIGQYRIGGLAQDDLSAESARKNLNAIAKTLLWVVGFLFFLNNVGIDITTLITGLGIGGIAVALAAQSLLGDIFSSFVIAVDKPFGVGDFIVVGDFSGTVEHIGLKTTRVRSISGELIVVGNSDLTSSRVKNYRRMQTRRISFKIGVTYDTPLKSLREIPQIIKEAIEMAPKTIFDRAHFIEFGPYILGFEIVYFVKDREFLSYVEAQQSMNLKILEEFEKRGIDMAFPTQTIHIARSEDVERKLGEPI